MAKVIIRQVLPLPVFAFVLVTPPLPPPVRRLPLRPFLFPTLFALQSSQYHVPALGALVKPMHVRWNYAQVSGR